MQTQPPPVVLGESEAKVIGRKVGYLVGAVVNGVLIWVMGNLLEWGWPSWLTDDFSEVFPAVRSSLVATLVTYLLYVLYDPDWFRALGDLVAAGFALAAGVAVWRVFPFDFAAYDTDWDLIARWVVGFGIFGVVVSMLANVVKLGKALVGGSADVPQVR